MKTCILFLFAVFIVKVSAAQIDYFAPAGSTWHFNHESFEPFNPDSVTYDYTKVETVGDTIIAGKQCSVLHFDSANNHTSQFPGTIYLYYDSGRVYRYFTDHDKWGLQYDFNAKAGDTLSFFVQALQFFDSVKVRVDSVGSVMINGISLRTQKYRIVKADYGWEYDQNVIEGIGGTRFLFLKYELGEDLNDGLRCYEDSTLGLYQTGLTKTCDTIIHFTGVKDVVQLPDVKIFPTIFHTHIHVKNEKKRQLVICIMNENSQTVFTGSVNHSERKDLDLSYLPYGIYVIKVSSGQLSATQKIIKMPVQ